MKKQLLLGADVYKRQEHPLYCDPLDAFVGRGFFFMTRQKGAIWNPDIPYDELKEAFDQYNICLLYTSRCV